MRTRSILVSGFASLAAIVAGCGSKPLQNNVNPAGTGGTIGTGTAGAGWLDAGVTDGAPLYDAGFTGRRSFVVSSKMQTDAGLSSHVFTMVLDVEPDKHLAIVGANGSGWAATLQQLADGTFRLDRSVVFSVMVPGACSANITYDRIGFNLDPSGGLTGAGHGQLTTFQTDVGNTVEVTTSLTGAPDTVTPTLFLTTDGTDISDPFSALWLSSPEPLPLDSYPVLRGAGGDVVVLTPSPTMDVFIAAFLKPNVLLRYGETYTVDLAGLADFAGNAARPTNALTFTTKAAPPLVAADGFESVTDAMLGGARVLSGPGAPTINGSRSLYVPPVTTAGAPPTTQLALRLAIAPGNTGLRFSYQNVILGSAPTFGAEYKVGSVGGTIFTQIPPSAPTSGTSATIDGTAVMLGPVTEGAIALPPDATGEVVFIRSTEWNSGCGLPYPPAPGVIIDDLRAE